MCVCVGGGGGTPGNKISVVVNNEKKPDWKILFLLMRGTVQFGILVHKEL